MASEDVDRYLEGIEEPMRSTLETLRRRIAAAIPEADEGLSYGVPVFRIQGKPIAGFSAATRHVSYLPHSGTVLASIDPAELEGFSTSKGAVKMTADTPLPDHLVRLLIATRRAEAEV
jgi:uncharacterized protein YdhG (YjbR/CyaY superfamily)